MYGVPKDLLGLLEGRQTYVIGKDGTVKLVYNSQFKACRPRLRPAWDLREGPYGLCPETISYSAWLAPVTDERRRKCQ